MTNFLKSFPDYLPHENSQVYYNTESKKVFSQSFIFEHSHDEIKALHSKPPTKEWQFYFNREPSQEQKDHLIKSFTNA